MPTPQPPSHGRPLSARLRHWQRLRGGRAFARPKGVGVFAHGRAALVRILPPWELAAAAAPAAGGAGAAPAPAASPAVLPVAAPAVLTAPAAATAPAANEPPPVAVQRRFGVVASRKVGNAVMRNRAKRAFRELFRRRQHELPARCDVLVIVRKDFPLAAPAELEALFEDALRRANRAFGAPRQKR